MRLVRAVIDTNVLVAAAAGSRGSAGKIMDAVVQGLFEMVLSPSILAELTDVLGRAKTKETLVDLSDLETAAFVHDLRATADMTAGTYVDIDMVPVDPNDNHVLACALEGLADYVVTLDRDLVLMRRRYVAGHRKLIFVTPAAFLEVLGRTTPAKVAGPRGQRKS